MSAPKSYVRVTLTAQQRRSRLRSLVVAMLVCDLLLVVLIVAAVTWFDGPARWALLAAALVPLTVALLALRGVVVLGRSPRQV
ncbi:MAG: hypothetical protein H0V38_06530 [Sporichthyaceae bacterium]|nr:hypothetical protein [Sporichthyaceae bacterium]